MQPMYPEPQQQKLYPLFALWPARYTLPQRRFARMIWVSDRARSTWEARIRKVARACSALAVESIKHGIRPAAQVTLTGKALPRRRAQWELLGLTVSVLNQPDRANPPAGREDCLQVAVGTKASVQSLAGAYAAKNVVAAGQALGYPQCCSKAYSATVSKGRWHDPIWPLSLEAESSTTPLRLLIEQDGPLETNILMHRLRIRATPHFPCNVRCPFSIELARQILTAGQDLGMDQEMDHLMEMLAWPMEWSALHGIAEIKTPLFKMTTDTDATEATLRIRRKGTAIPTQSATGTQFPYNSQLTTTASAVKSDEEPALNGFKSNANMETAHSALAQVARSRLQSVEGEILDLGCGTGALLRKLTAGLSLSARGVDVSSRAVDLARNKPWNCTTEFVVADLFTDSALWNQHYRLALVSLKRLTEVEPERAQILISRLRSRVDHLLIYLYTEHASPLNFGRVGSQFGLGLAAPIKFPSVTCAWAFS